VPFAEQSRELVVGERQPFGLYVDQSDRLAATMYVTELLGERRRVVIDEWIEGVAWRNDPDIGLFAILERRFVGLVPATEPHRLSRGEAAKFRVAAMYPDGKLVLSLRQHAFQELAADAARVLAHVAQPGAARVGDRSPADEIRARFGLSKKAFKRAIGHLLKTGRGRSRSRRVRRAAAAELTDRPPRAGARGGAARFAHAPAWSVVCKHPHPMKPVLALAAFAFLAPHAAHAWSIGSQLNFRGCHEPITARRCAAPARVYATAPALTPSRNEAAMIADVLFQPPDDFVGDLAGMSLVIGVRDNDTKGNDPLNTLELQLVHGNRRRRRSTASAGTRTTATPATRARSTRAASTSATPRPPRSTGSTPTAPSTRRCVCRSRCTRRSPAPSRRRCRCST